MVLKAEIMAVSWVTHGFSLLQRKHRDLSASSHIRAQAIAITIAILQYQRDVYRCNEYNDEETSVSIALLEETGCREEQAVHWFLNTQLQRKPCGRCEIYLPLKLGSLFPFNAAGKLLKKNLPLQLQWYEIFQNKFYLSEQCFRLRDGNNS